MIIMHEESNSTHQFCSWKDVPPKHIYKVDQELWDGELSLSACPGVVSRPPRTKKTANPRGMPVVAWQQVKLNQQLNNYEVILGLQPREKAALLKVKTI